MAINSSTRENVLSMMASQNPAAYGLINQLRGQRSGQIQPLPNQAQQDASALPAFNYRYQVPPNQLGQRFTGMANQGDYAGVEKGSLARDYYTKAAQEYLPQLNSWAQQNAGKMVNVGDIDQGGMTAADFGVVWRRGDSKNQMDPGYWIGDQYYNEAPLTYNYDKGALSNYDQFSGAQVENPRDLFYKDERGNLRNAFLENMGDDSGMRPTSYVMRAPDGAELFRGNRDEFGQVHGPQAVGTYRPETTQDFLDRFMQSGGLGNTKVVREGEAGKKDEGFINTVLALGKFKDYYPEYANLLDDPNWVQRDEAGNIVSARAELVPALTSAGLQLNNDILNQGYKARSKGFGGVVTAIAPALILGPAAGALAGGLGLTGAAANVAAGAMAAGAGTAIQGGNFSDTLKSAAMGGIGGGLGSYVKGTDMMKSISNPMLRAGASGAITGTAMGGLGAVLNDGDLLKGALSGGISGGLSAIGGQLGGKGGSMLGKTLGQYASQQAGLSPYQQRSAQPPRQSVNPAFSQQSNPGQVNDLSWLPEKARQRLSGLMASSGTPYRV